MPLCTKTNNRNRDMSERYVCEESPNNENLFAVKDTLAPKGQMVVCTAWHDIQYVADALNANSGDALELLRVTHNRLIDTLGDREYERSVQGQDAARLLAAPPEQSGESETACAFCGKEVPPLTYHACQEPAKPATDAGELRTYLQKMCLQAKSLNLSFVEIGFDRAGKIISALQGSTERDMEQQRIGYQRALDDHEIGSTQSGKVCSKDTLVTSLFMLEGGEPTEERKKAAIKELNEII